MERTFLGLRVYIWIFAMGLALGSSGGAIGTTVTLHALRGLGVYLVRFSTQCPSSSVPAALPPATPVKRI